MSKDKVTPSKVSVDSLMAHVDGAYLSTPDLTRASFDDINEEYFQSRLLRVTQASDLGLLSPERVLAETKSVSAMQSVWDQSRSGKRIDVLEAEVARLTAKVKAMLG